jgi:hypothetical protein
LKTTLLIFFILVSSLPQARADGPLPIAPSRSDDRDELPTDPFVSMTGLDPVVPGENPTAVATATPAGKPDAHHGAAQAKAVGKTQDKKSVSQSASKTASKGASARSPASATKKQVTVPKKAVAPVKGKYRTPANLPKKLPKKKVH